MAMFEQKPDLNISLENVIATAIQLPGVKVNRELFLREQFLLEPRERIDAIVKYGPVNAQVSQDTLSAMAKKIINERTIVSTGASFVAGLPGGFAMAATIPADLVQFYAIALRMAQELAYLYGEQDFWNGESIDYDKVTSQLILYCGVMLDASGAAQVVRMMSSRVAKKILNKLPQKTVTKAIYYPVVKGVCKFFGLSVTKSLFAKSVSKAVPILGGLVSGGITYATLRPMGQRLADTLHDANFSYTESDFQEDWEDVVEIREEETTEEVVREEKAESVSTSGIMEEIKKAKQLYDAGILTEQEFADMKAKLIAKL